MKFKLPVIALLLAATLLVSSCSSTNIVINVEVTCEEFEYKSSDLANEFEIEIGDQIKAKMCTNPSTGFSWDYTIQDEDVMQFVSHDYIEPDGDLAGAPGIDVWLFKAVGKGETLVEMSYGQAWDGGTKDELTYTMNVTSMKNR